MRVIYRYFDAKSERFLRCIENIKELDLTPVSNFSQLNRALKAIGGDPALVVVEKTRAEDAQVLHFLRTTAIPGRKIMVLVFAVAPDPDPVKDAIERTGAKYMLRRSGLDAEEHLLDGLAELRRLLRRVLVKGLLRIAIAENGSARIWVRRRDQVEREWVLSPQFERLVVMLAQNRYVTAAAISKTLGITKKSANTYLDRLRDYFNRFNRKELHLPLRGKNLFQTLHYADLDIYRLNAAVDWAKKTG